MFLVCWHFCIPFLNFLMLAIGPILFIVGAYVLKRGLVRYRKPLRKRALIIWLIAFVKMALIDFRILAQDLFCDLGVCSKIPNMMINISSIILMGGLIIYWMSLYKKLVPDAGQVSPSAVSGDIGPLKRWTRYSTAAVVIFVFWVSAPFFIGMFGSGLPSLFLILSWHYFAILALAALLMAFWKLEEYQWYYSSTKSKLTNKKDVWIPKDTLWTLVFIYGVTAIMAFASSKMIEEAARGLH